MNRRYLEFISSFDDHSNGKKKLDKVSCPQKKIERSYCGSNFFNPRDLSIQKAISRGEYMPLDMQGKNNPKQLPEITPSTMAKVFKRLRLHELIEKIPGSYKSLLTALGKEIIAASLTVKNLTLVPELAS